MSRVGLEAGLRCHQPGGGIEAEAEAIAVIGGRDRSRSQRFPFENLGSRNRSQWLPDLKSRDPKPLALGYEADAEAEAKHEAGA